MARSGPNYRVRNVAFGIECGHHHHTREKALACMVALGWNPKVCIVERFFDSKDRKASMHHKGWHKRGTREEEYRPEPYYEEEEEVRE